MKRLWNLINTEASNEFFAFAVAIILVSIILLIGTEL